MRLQKLEMITATTKKEATKNNTIVVKSVIFFMSSDGKGHEKVISCKINVPTIPLRFRVRMNIAEGQLKM